MTGHQTRLLFLGYGENETRLISEFRKTGCAVTHTAEPVVSFAGYDLAVSFGYRHILKKELLERTTIAIINLHIAYLPYNRGSHPNFWAFYDGTPSGVTIHLIDGGIDTGPILYQKKVEFNAWESSFAATYTRLIQEIEQLCIAHITEIVTQTFVRHPQTGEGTFHRKRDLPKEMTDWNVDIASTIQTLRQKYGELSALKSVE